MRALLLVLAILTSTISASLPPFLMARQDADAEGCLLSCSQSAAKSHEKEYEQCASQSTIEDQQKCFCKKGLYSASAACIDKCFPADQRDSAAQILKQACDDAENGKGLDSDSGDDDGGDSTGSVAELLNAGSSLGASGLGMALVGAVALAVL